MKNKKQNSDKKIEYIEELEEEKVGTDMQKKIKRTKEQLKKCQEEKNEYLKGWQRERADFINYRNEEGKRKKDLVSYSKGGVMLEFLLILDSLEKAEKEISKELKDNSWAKGIVSIKNQLKDIFKKEGVEEIKDNESFNPEIHEAVEIGGGEEGKILKVLQKGYFLEGQVLRPTRVKVGKNIK